MSWTDGAASRAILDDLPVNVFVCDLDLKMTYVSPTARQTMEALRGPVHAEFGVDVDELLQMSIHRFHKDPAGVERILARPESFPHHASFALAGLQLLTTITAVYDERREIIGYIAVVDNVTEKHELAQRLTRTASELRDSSLQLAGLSQQLETTTGEVTRQAEAMSAGTEELTASIHSVSASTAAVTVSAQAVIASAQAATNSVAKLADSSTRIGDIIGLITSISEQTKLLALNATIEATRAGAAGSGFAVVAGEVKDLAQRTRGATDQIAQMVAAIQSDSAEAGTAIGEILSGIRRVGDQQAEISTAIEQQAGSAQEIAAVVEGVATSIGGVASATSAIRESAAAMSERARELDELVSGD